MRGSLSNTWPVSSASSTEALVTKNARSKNMFLRSIVAAFASLFLVSAASFADEISTRPLGNSHLALGGGQALLDASNPNAVVIDGSRSSTFLQSSTNSATTNTFTKFVEGQRAFITLANVGTNQNASVKFTDPTPNVSFFLPTNNLIPVVVEASYIDGTYRVRSITEPTVRQLTLGTNQVANWPTAAAFTNQATIVTSNNVVYILTTTLNTTTIGATNKLAP